MAGSCGDRLRAGAVMMREGDGMTNSDDLLKRLESYGEIFRGGYGDIDVRPDYNDCELVSVTFLDKCAARIRELEAQLAAADEHAKRIKLEAALERITNVHHEVMSDGEWHTCSDGEALMKKIAIEALKAVKGERE